jgi:hypothetical protein
MPTWHAGGIFCATSLWLKASSINLNLQSLYTNRLMATIAPTFFFISLAYRVAIDTVGCTVACPIDDSSKWRYPIATKS